MPNSIDASSKRPSTSICSARFLCPALTTLAVVFAAAVLLHWQGRRWWCACGRWFLWSSDAWGPHNSQHLLDPYSLTHVLHGVILFGLLTFITPQLEFRWRFMLAVCIECAWEVIENSSFVISRYRAATAAQGYEGDSIANSLGDILSCAIGFYLASRLGWWKSLALFCLIELLLLFWIRDSLVLNVVMLIFPLKMIRGWQTEG